MTQKQIAIVGSGPAALMAASVLAKAGVGVSVFEKTRGPAPKLLIAGKSGLNISNATDSLLNFYDGPKEHFEKIFQDFSVQDWIQFIEDLGIKTFLGTSGRYFVEGLKAGQLLKTWKNFLEGLGVQFYFDSRLTDFGQNGVVSFQNKESKNFDAICLCLGGGSWGDVNEIQWPEIFQNKGLAFKEFQPENVGYEVAWKEAFLKEAEGLPLKNITVTSPQGIQHGEVVITNYGLEGTPIYSLRKAEKVFLDLKPDLSLDEIKMKFSKEKENLSPMRKIKKHLNLCEGSLALLYHHGDSENLLESVKKFPIELINKRDLSEAISSSGGLCFSEVDENLMLKEYPGVFLAGEMLDWSAPTGGFLIQACVSQGHYVGNRVLEFFD